VLVIIEPKRSQEIFRIQRPDRVISQRLSEASSDLTEILLQSQLPCLSWGYGYSPMIQDKVNSLLAISWGPLIQLVILQDVSPDEETFGNY
jgi:hypothetical protein